jgi:lysophospholipase L1-like esterase
MAYTEFTLPRRKDQPAGLHWPLAAIVAAVALLIGATLELSADDDKPALPRVAEKLAAGQPVKIVCLGDSVTGVYYHTGGRRAYPEMVGVALAQLYPAAKITIINAGVSGNSTQDALKRLQTDVFDHKPDLVTVMFGLNDMVRVPLADYQSNLKSIIEQGRAVGAEVLLCTPNAVIETGGRPTARLLEYTRAMKDVGQKLQVPVCDCYAAHGALRERDPLAWRLLMSDAIHPNMDGHKLNALALCRSISGRDVSLRGVAPPTPALPRTLARLKAGEPLRVLAMPPYDRMIEKSLRGVFPTAKVDVTQWPTEGRSLAEIEEASKAVRAKEVDLVVLAIPAAVTPSEDPPAEAGIASYTWILNWSLSFGYQQWDVMAIAPSVLKSELSEAEKKAEKFARRLIVAQDLIPVVRRDDDDSPPQKILDAWLRDELSQR